jgi:hypothetical protein
LAAGILTDEHVDRAIAQRHVRPDLRLGPNGRNGWIETLGAPVHQQRLVIRNMVRWLAYRTGWAR